MGAEGHMRGVDSAFLFSVAPTDDKLFPKSAQNTLDVTQTIQTDVVRAAPAEEAGNCESPCRGSWQSWTPYETLLYLGKLELWCALKRLPAAQWASL